MTTRNLKILVMVAALSMTGCAINEAGPAEFSVERITISNPLAASEDPIR